LDCVPRSGLLKRTVDPVLSEFMTAAASAAVVNDPRPQSPPIGRLRLTATSIAHARRRRGRRQREGGEGGASPPPGGRRQRPPRRSPRASASGWRGRERLRPRRRWRVSGGVPRAAAAPGVVPVAPLKWADRGDDKDRGDGGGGPSTAVRAVALVRAVEGARGGGRRRPQRRATARRRPG